MSPEHPRWTIDLSRRIASHPDGLTLEFEGAPDGSDFTIIGIKQDSRLPHLQFLALMRQGVGEYRQTYQHSPPPKLAATPETSSNPQNYCAT